MNHFGNTYYLRNDVYKYKIDNEWIKEFLWGLFTKGWLV